MLNGVGRSKRARWNFRASLVGREAGTEEHLAAFLGRPGGGGGGGTRFGKHRATGACGALGSSGRLAEAGCPLETGTPVEAGTPAETGIPAEAPGSGRFSGGGLDGFGGMSNSPDRLYEPGLPDLARALLMRSS